MASPDYNLSAKYGIRVAKGDTLISDIDQVFTDYTADLEAKFTGYVAGTHAARLAATPLEGQVWRETDTGGQLCFLGTGSVWVQISGPRVTHQVHAFSSDDLTAVANGVSAAAGWINYQTTETVSLLGVVMACASQGATPSTFKIQTDHTSHGTFADEPGLTTLTPPLRSSGASYAARTVSGTATPLVLASLDQVLFIATNAGTGTSKGLSVGLVTEHAA